MRNASFTTVSDTALEKMHQKFYHPPYDTPWGALQYMKMLANGVFEVSSASHGGIMICRDIAAEILSEEALKCSFYEYGYFCFEEDCVAAIPIRELMDKDLIDVPDYFNGDKKKYSSIIDETLKLRFPDYWNARSKALNAQFKEEK